MILVTYYQFEVEVIEKTDLKVCYHDIDIDFQYLVFGDICII